MWGCAKRLESRRQSLQSKFESSTMFLLILFLIGGVNVFVSFCVHCLDLWLAHAVACSPTESVSPRGVAMLSAASRYERVWSSLARSKKVDKYGGLSKAHAMSVLSLSGLKKSAVKTIFTFADQRPPRGTLVRFCIVSRKHRMCMLSLSLRTHTRHESTLCACFH